MASLDIADPASPPQGQTLRGFLTYSRRRVMVDRTIAQACRAVFWVALGGMPLTACRSAIGLADSVLALILLMAMAGLFGLLLWGKRVRLAQVPDYLRAEQNDHDRIATATEFMNESDVFKRLSIRQAEAWIAQAEGTIQTKTTWPRHAIAAVIACVLHLLLFLFTPSAVRAEPPPLPPADQAMEPPATSQPTSQPTPPDPSAAGGGEGEVKPDAPSNDSPNQGGSGGQGANGQGGSGQGTNGQGAGGQGASGQGANGQGANGQGTNGQGASGQGGVGQGTGGQGANEQGANGPDANPQGANGQGAGGSGANAQGPSGPKAEGKGAAGQDSTSDAEPGSAEAGKPGSDAGNKADAADRANVGKAAASGDGAGADIASKTPADRKATGPSLDVSGGTSEKEKPGDGKQIEGQKDPDSAAPIAAGGADPQTAYSNAKVDPVELEALPPNRRRVVSEYFRRSPAPPAPPATQPGAP